MRTILFSVVVLVSLQSLQAQDLKVPPIKVGTDNPQSVFETNADMVITTDDKKIEIPKGTKVWNGPYVIFELANGDLWYVPPKDSWRGLTVAGKPIPTIKVSIPKDDSNKPIKIEKTATTTISVGGKQQEKMTLEGVAIHWDEKQNYYVEDITGERAMLFGGMLGRTKKAVQLNPTDHPEKWLSAKEIEALPKK